MKISVLLPTRERLPLLRQAVQSVLRLDDQDCEVVISDNASSEDIGGFVESLNDRRVVYVRSAHPLPVTENWNKALENSSGDYVIMLGDDDALLRNYFARTRQLITDFNRPHVIYHNALVYAYPGVVPGEPTGFLRSEGYAEFLQDVRDPFELGHEKATAMVQAAMAFRLRYGFNMQFVTVARDILLELSHNGPFFRSPFPDYYAMNHLFCRAHTIVVDPQPMVVIGVSPRSYGFFHNNRQETAGRAFLQGESATTGPEPAAEPLLPGTNINDGWLGAMRELHSELGSPPKMRPDYSRYRMLQITYVYEGHYLRGSIDTGQFNLLKQYMTWRERLLYGGMFSVIRLFDKVGGTRTRRTILNILSLSQRQFRAWDPVRDPDSYRDIDDVVTRIDPTQDPQRWQHAKHSRARNVLIRRLG